MFESLTPQQWLQLKPSTRQALIKIFRIPQSSFTHVFGDRLESTGHTYEDLKAISVPEMKLLTHSPSDSFQEQFDLIIKMIESDGSPAAPIQSENATQNGSENQSVSTPVSGTVAAAVNTRTEEGIKPQEEVGKAEVLPVSGGEQQVDRGSNDVLPGVGNNDTASVAGQDEKVDAKKPRSGKAAK